MKFKKNVTRLLFLTGLCIILLIVFDVVTKYGDNKKFKQDRKRYISYFYFHLDGTIHLLSSIDEWKGNIQGTDITINPCRQLLIELNALEVLNEQGAWYMRNDKNSYFLRNLSESFRLIQSIIGSGVSLDNQPLCDDFLKDGIISENEVSFLVSLKQDLESMKNKMYCEETKQENQNLTMKELSEIVKPFTDKYSFSNLENIELKN